MRIGTLREERPARDSGPSTGGDFDQTAGVWRSSLAQTFHLLPSNHLFSPQRHSDRSDGLESSQAFDSGVNSIRETDVE